MSSEELARRQAVGDADPAATGAPSSGPLLDADAQEREDIDEDRRTQRELDDAELGGEA